MKVNLEVEVYPNGQGFVVPMCPNCNEPTYNEPRCPFCNCELDSEDNFISMFNVFTDNIEIARLYQKFKNNTIKIENEEQDNEKKYKD